MKTATLAERAADEIDFRYRMAADLGYGPTGPKNIQQLTLPELRTFAEGIRRETERQNQRFSGGSDGDRDRPKGQPRESDKEMARELQEELEAQDGPAV